jgi:hypothetical protein
MIRRLPVKRGGERLCDLLKRIDEACDDRGIGAATMHDLGLAAGHANLAVKQKALAKIPPMDTPFRRFRPGDRLLAFLEAL